MAYGKNKGLAKGGKKGQKKKQQDPFLRKVWYDVKAPSYFAAKTRRAGRTFVTKTTGTKIETDGLKNRVCEFNVADLNNPEDGHKKMKLEIMEIQGKSCLTDFHSMNYTRDEMCKMVKKKHTLVDAIADCKTTDGYVVRLQCLAMTARPDNMTAHFCYAQTAQVRKIRKKMIEVMTQNVAQGGLAECVRALLANKMETDMKKATSRLFPLDPIRIVNAKLLKKPKLDIVKLMEIHKGNEDDGVAVDVEENPEAKNLLNA